MGPATSPNMRMSMIRNKLRTMETTKIKMIFIGISSAAAGVDKSGDLSPKTNKQRLS